MLQLLFRPPLLHAANTYCCAGDGGYGGGDGDAGEMEGTWGAGWGWGDMGIVRKGQEGYSITSSNAGGGRGPGGPPFKNPHLRLHRCAAVTPDNQTMHTKHQLQQQIRLHRWDGLLRRGGARQPRDAHQAPIIAANSFATLGCTASPRRHPTTTRCSPRTNYSSRFDRNV